MAAQDTELLSFTHEDVERSIPERFAAVAGASPSALAIAGASERLTYRDLARRTDALAAAIMRRASSSEAPVAVLLNDQVAMITALLATWKAGKLCVPLESTLPKARLEVILREAGAGLVVADQDSAPLLPDTAGGTLRIDDIDLRSTGDLASAKVTPDAPACLIYTSGSTGEPKGVMRSHRSLLQRTRCSVETLTIGPEDRISLLHSPAFGVGLRDALAALLSGAALYPFDMRHAGLGALAEWINREQISVLCGVVTTLRHFFASQRLETRFPSIRIVRLGSEPLYRQDVEEIRKCLSRDCVLVAGYGATEASGIVEYRIERDTPLPSGRIPAGYPLEDVEIVLLDEDGRPLADAEVGEVAVRSRYLASGYWRRPELTRRSFLSDPADPQVRTYRTGDIGRLRPDGCLEILGRRDHQVKVRGYLVHPGEIELALVEHPLIREAVVTAMIGDDGGTRLAAYVVPRGSEAPRTWSLRQHLRGRLPAYMLPSAFVVLDAFPATASGKVDREALPPPPKPAVTRDANFVAPRSPIEHQIAAIWEDLFGVSPIGVHENYFDLGGDSLLAAKFVTQLQEVCGAVLSPSVFLEAPTIADLAAAVMRNQNGFKEPLTALRTSGERAPLFFLHNDDGRGLYTHALARCLDPDRPFYAVHLHGVDEPRCAATVEAIAASRIPAVRAVQRHGPYVLGGHCHGGLIALEMARKLRDAGEEVELVVMVDTHAPSRRFPTLRRASNAVGRLRGPLDRVWEGAGWRTRYYRSRLGMLRRESVRTQMDYLFRKLTGLARPATAMQVGATVRGEGMLDRAARPDFTASRRMHRQAVRQYVPSRYTGPVVLFRAELFPADRPDLGWSRLLPRLQVVVIPGDHHSCITRHVATFGARLNEILRRAHPAAANLRLPAAG